MTKLELRSPLAPELLQYRQHRIDLHYYNGPEMDSFYLELDRLLVSRGIKKKEIPRSITEAWCRKRAFESVGNRFKRVCQLRQLCIYLADYCNCKVYIPPKKIAPTAKRYEAHIFSDEELHRFFHAVDHPKFTHAGTLRRDLMLPLYFRILYTSGMRSTELATIRVADINLEDAVITVRNGKNGKDRLVPFHPSLVDRCRKVMQFLDAPTDSQDYFFQIKDGKCFSKEYVYSSFRTVLERA